MRWFTLDYETKSTVDLLKYGLDNYVNCPEFDAIVAVAKERKTGVRSTASAYGDTPISVHDLMRPLLEDKEVHFIAHNAMFEWVVSNELCKRWGIPAPALSRFHCSSLKASIVGLPAALDKVAMALFGKRKLVAGSDHIKLFCVPRGDGQFNKPFDFPEEWAEFLMYCEVDVDLADEAWNALPSISPETRLYWLSTARMNLRGFKLDLNAINKVLGDVRLINEDAVAVTKSITKGLVSKPTERKKLLAFLNEAGFQGKSLSSAIVDGWIRDTNTSDEIRELLWARLAASKSTFGKYAAFVRFMSDDWRSRHSFWANGTHTGRLAGKGTQPQNIAYDKERDPEKRLPSAIELLNDYMLDLLPDKELSRYLVAMTRAMIMAEDGEEFYIVDYASIEARIVVWLANEVWALRKYEKNEDLYIPMAATILRVKECDITKAMRDFFGKTTVLGGSYGMGPPRFSQQNDMSLEDGKRCIYAYRNKYPMVVAYWKLIENAFKTCLLYGRHTKCKAPGNNADIPVVRFRPEIIGGISYIVCTPPGNREIWYRDPQLANNGDLSYERITYKGTFRQKLWGGVLTENVCQNIAGVIISRGMMALERHGVPAVLQVHDELVCEVLKGRFDKKVLDLLMTRIHGFTGLPLAVESRLAPRFSK